MDKIQCIISLLFMIPMVLGYCSEAESELLQTCYDNFFEALEVADDYDYIITHRSLIKETVGTEYLCSHFKNLTECLGPSVINNCLTMNEFAAMFDDPESLLKYYGTLDYECQKKSKMPKSSWKKCTFNTDLSCTLAFKNCASLKQSIKDCAKKAQLDCGDKGYFDVYNVIVASNRLVYPHCKLTLIPFENIVKTNNKEDKKYEKLEAAMKLLLSEKQLSHEIMKTKVLPILMESIESADPVSHFKTIEIFNACVKRHRSYIYELYPTFPNLINLCESKNSTISIGAINILGKIVELSPRLRDDCIEMGLIQTLTELISPKVSATPVTILRAVTSTILKIVKPQSSVVSQKTIAELIPYIKKYMDHQDYSIFFNSIQSFENLFKKEYKNQNDAILNDKMIQKILSFLDRDTPDVVVFGAINNIILDTEANITQKFLKNNLLKKLPKFFDKERNIVYVLLIIRNIFGKGENEIQAVIDANLLPQVLKFLKHPDTSLNAVFVIAEYTKNANPKQIKIIFEMDIVWSLCGILRTTADYKTQFLCILKSLYEITIGLDELENLGVNVYGQLSKCNGLEYIESFYNSDDDEIQEYTRRLIDEITDAFEWLVARSRLREDI